MKLWCCTVLYCIPLAYRVVTFLRYLGSLCVSDTIHLLGENLTIDLSLLRPLDGFGVTVHNREISLKLHEVANFSAVEVTELSQEAGRTT